jgi:dTDP-4-dehydrorhamnose 3,5-epimerase
VFIPSGLLHGFQVLSDVADGDLPDRHRARPRENRAVRYDDPDLAISWPLPVAEMSPRDAADGSWAELVNGMSS